MQILVLIERVEGNGYRAKGGEPFGLAAEGATREEALRKLREVIEDKLRKDSHLVSLEIPDNDNPWLRMAGMFKEDDPLVKEWIQIMEENRRNDEDTDYL